MLNGIPFLPKNLFAAAMATIREKGYCKEKPPKPGDFLPFVVTYADAACRGLGLHNVMDVVPGTKIPLMAQIMHEAGPISCWDGVVGVTMEPDRFLQPPKGQFDSWKIMGQWLPFLNWLSPGLSMQNLRAISRPDWYEWVMGNPLEYDPGLPDDFEVHAVAQTSAVEDFGNLTLVHNLAAGPLARLPWAIGPDLAGLMSCAGHSNTLFAIGINDAVRLRLGSSSRLPVVQVEQSVAQVLRAAMEVWSPDEGFPQPKIRVAKTATAISKGAGEEVRAAFHEGAWKHLPPPEELEFEAMLEEAMVRGTIIVISSQRSQGMGVITNGVSREPAYDEIPTGLLPRKRL